MNAVTPNPEILWTDIGAVTDIPRRGARRAPTPEGDIAIFRTGENEIFALVDSCPHKAGPLSQGIVHGRTVTCPLHGWIIDLASGQPTGADAGKGCVLTAPIEVREGRIHIGTVRR